MNAGSVQGILSWNGVVTPWPAAEAQSFLRHYRPLPIVNIGLPLPGIHSVAFDQSGGVSAAVAHLCDAHPRRRIAFLTPASSHPGMAAGFEGYVQALSARGGYRADLVVQAPPEITLAALDAQGMQPGLDYDAVICPLDSLAMQTIVELQGRGVRVPEDVAVIGVHDGQEARLVTPSLTTVQLPWEKARWGAEILLDLIAGKAAAEAYCWVRRWSCAGRAGVWMRGPSGQRWGENQRRTRREPPQTRAARRDASARCRIGCR